MKYVNNKHWQVFLKKNRIISIDFYLLSAFLKISYFTLRFQLVLLKNYMIYRLIKLISSLFASLVQQVVTSITSAITEEIILRLERHAHHDPQFRERYFEVDQQVQIQNLNRSTPTLHSTPQRPRNRWQRSRNERLSPRNDRSRSRNGRVRSRNDRSRSTNDRQRSSRRRSDFPRNPLQSLSRNDRSRSRNGRVRPRNDRSSSTNRHQSSSPPSQRSSTAHSSPARASPPRSSPPRSPSPYDLSTPGSYSPRSPSVYSYYRLSPSSSMAVNENNNNQSPPPSPRSATPQMGQQNADLVNRHQPENDVLVQVDVRMDAVDYDSDDTVEFSWEAFSQELNLPIEISDDDDDGDNLIETTRQCPICLESQKKPAALQCGHVFCYKCIKKWFNGVKYCPKCRQTSPNGIIELFF